MFSVVRSAEANNKSLAAVGAQHPETVILRLSAHPKLKLSGGVSNHSMKLAFWQQMASKEMLTR